MASSHQQANNSPGFFKIILRDTIRNRKLAIPRKFVENHGDDMSSPALLKVPTGAVWRVELTKCDGKLWLENGWQEFSNHYSLDFGHLLVFRYHGNSNFHVLIYDRSALEIQYPSIKSFDESVDDDSMNISPSKETREKSNSSPSPRPHKRMRSTRSSIETERTAIPELLAQQVSSRDGCQVRRDNKRGSHCTISRLEAAMALDGASKAFKSENPYFLVVMQPSYIGLGQVNLFRLSIPRNFVEKHLRTAEHCSVVLCDSSGKTWIASFSKIQKGKRLNSFLLAGWVNFVRDNNIRVGDVCAFELINSIEKISFNVVIYKGPHANCHPVLKV